ncbi:MAG TPA: LacI family DNA-binding transcriptional regulator, partial [Polyangiaceae bacterium]|nr:LacI family DNA-binding transcriptional regulator [Polyangiaceae bacterium]
TVSFVLNSSPGQVISDTVKKRVLAVTERLGYYPSAAAAGLARKRTRNVALVFYQDENLITNLLYSFVVQGAIKEAAARGYNVLFSFVPSEYKLMADLPLVVRERNAEGVLFIQAVSERMVSDMQARGVACVAVDNHPLVDGLESVSVDNRKGAELAVKHLADLGHTQIGFLRAGADRPSIAERSEAFRAALLARGLPFSQRRNVFDGAALSFHAGYEQARRVLSARSELTALFCANDEMAAGALRAAREVGRSVPGQLSVVGFDDVIMSNYVDPPLTTVGCNKEGMGRLAMARLLARVEAGAPEGRGQEAPRHLLPVELVVRRSTARL